MLRPFVTILVENLMVNYAAAQEAEPTEEVLAARKRIHKTARQLLRRMRRLGFLEFRFDQEILFLFCPVQTKIYRFVMEKLGREL